MTLTLGFLLAALVSASAPGQVESELSNGYIYLRARDGWFDQLKLDPAGEGRYGDNLIKSLSIGDVPGETKGLRVEQQATSITFRKLPVRTELKFENTKANHPYELKPGSTLGVRFTVASGWITRAGGTFPTWHKTGSGMTLSLYRLPDGDMTRKVLVTSRKIADVPDNSAQSLDFDAQPAGVFYLEVSERSGDTIGWWGSDSDSNPSAVAYIDGKEAADVDLTLTYSGFEELSGDWTVTLDGPNLKGAFELAEQDSAKPQPPLQMVTAWKKSGYDVSMSPFTRFYTDRGQHVIIQQLKRRSESSLLHYDKWICAVGRKDADVRFNLSPGQRLSWHTSEDAMTWRLTGTSLDLEALPHSEKLPDSYPIFYSSDNRYAKALTEFFYSHGLNFGVGTPPDWKEWQALILDWTCNPQREEQRGHFTGVRMRPDGYVYTWGADEGWPFPYKDEDKDGKNDYDTRHFTTNSCFILGAYRYFVWTRDMDFLREVMPKMRAAMAYNLNQLQGQEGIIIIDAKGHEGRHDGIGSNYWDILPFGYKDAFCNTYYYAALGAMEDLERFCADLDLPGEKRPPEFYNNLRNRVRRQYNRTFWDPKVGRYIGCVDVDGVKHDYGFTFVNLEAMTYGLADKEQVQQIYRWMETEPTSSGKADTYSQWIFAPRATTIHNPPRQPSAISHQPSAIPDGPSAIDHRPSTIPSWWHFGWGGTPFGDQCQDGGAILYTSGYDIMARAKYLGADNAYKRLKEILDRYNMPDRLCGGSPLYRGEKSQGGEDGAGSVGVESEFPESGLAPASFVYAFLGIQADTEGVKIRPNLPSSLKFAGVRNLCYAGTRYDIRVTNDSVEITPLDVVNPMTIRKKLAPGETYVLTHGTVVSR